MSFFKAVTFPYDREGCDHFTHVIIKFDCIWNANLKQIVIKFFSVIFSFPAHMRGDVREIFS